MLRQSAALSIPWLARRIRLSERRNLQGGLCPAEVAILLQLTPYTAMVSQKWWGNPDELLTPPPPLGRLGQLNRHTGGNQTAGNRGPGSQGDGSCRRHNAFKHLHLQCQFGRWKSLRQLSISFIQIALRRDFMTIAGSRFRLRNTGRYSLPLSSGCRKRRRGRQVVGLDISFPNDQLQETIKGHEASM